MFYIAFTSCARMCANGYLENWNWEESELRMVSIEWISMEIDGCAAMRKWFMLHLVSRGNSLSQWAFSEIHLS